MVARSQRILAGIELFALSLWVGGLFFLLALVKPGLREVLFPEDPDTAWRVMNTLYARFGGLEVIFAVVVLASNFLKLVVFRGMAELQRYAVMVAAIMVTLAVFCTYQLRPMLEEKRTSFVSMVKPDANSAEQVQKFSRMRSRYETFMWTNMVLGLFMLYAYRSFEERKLQAITKILKAP